MRILHIAETVKGGVATYLELIDGNVPYEHHYLIPASQESEISVDRSKLIVFPGTSRPQRIVGLFQTLARLKDKQSYDIVHLHSSFAGYIFTIQKLLGFKFPAIIFCAHGWSFQRKVSKLERTICKAADYITGRLSTGIIHISKTEQVAASFIPCDLQRHIYNPISYNYLTPLKKTHKANTIKNILFVGRLDRQKGFDILYEAFKSKDLKEFHLYVAGNSVLCDSEYKSTANVTFLGWQSRDALPSMYEDADLTIVPSRWEGFGFVAIESLARGTPVLASHVGSLPEILGKYGQISDMTTANSIIKTIIKYKTSATETPVKLQEYIREKYSPTRFSAEILDFYQQAVEKEESKKRPSLS
ncbi:glycosyltransferase family 4 protein [Pseudomonas sp. GD04087]|uniref:glycosyltransferase family 4 protein n=1 Tax=unclassified Pseudomonas TaxID=196821 RepID=UPI00244B375D|nr:MULTISPECIES: glycosyltransferase family 4 protein [unclassified Pseudomonas]MDH0291985.1 glycosyltransferase family 4 protein [Pseudomonas sp. GD04087]MDH1052833.1 glycosyltransferase family 4 protein [Pseudomonas sp. GD03903]MDH2001996.1 glycosyltransferase family 4 protein [Pseudomonas sp. GD03691]